MANGNNGNAVDNSRLTMAYNVFLKEEYKRQIQIDRRKDLTLVEKASEGTPEARAWERVMQKYQV